MSWPRGHALVSTKFCTFPAFKRPRRFLNISKHILEKQHFLPFVFVRRFPKSTLSDFHFGSVEDEQSCKHEERSLAKMYFEGQAYICSNIYMFSCFYEIFPIY